MRCRVVLVARIYNCRAQHDLIFERKDVFLCLLLCICNCGSKATGAKLWVLVGLTQRGVDVTETDSLAVRIGLFDKGRHFANIYRYGRRLKLLLTAADSTVHLIHFIIFLLYL